MLGKGFDQLDISNKLARDIFESLCHNLDPATGQLLRPHAREGDRVGMDFTFSCPKSVSIARELAGADNRGDPRIEEAHREAVKYAMAEIEKNIQTRVKGGREGDRITGNLMAYRVTHRDSRINPDDQLPDMHLHDHVFVLNHTYDPVEGVWKAVQLADIKHAAAYYESLYHARLADNLRHLGYGIRRAGGKAFEIEGIGRDTIETFSRRHEHIKGVEAKLPNIGAKGKDKLGATTRLGKSKELIENLNPYFVSRLTEPEADTLRSLYRRPSYESTDKAAMQYAIGHEFERSSVVEEKKLYETALRFGVGSVTISGLQAEAKRQGVLVKNGQATTKAIREEERRIIQYARDGRSTVRPLKKEGLADPGMKQELSAEQRAMVNHVLRSQDKMILVIGDAGTGKSHSIKAAFAAIDRPIELLAPSVEASRGVLRRDGFAKADTVASFLRDADRQAAVKGGLIWIDEAGLLPVKDLSKLVDIAEKFNARLVLGGDPKQHKAVLRGGNMMNVLQEFAMLPVGRLTEVWRQQNKEYRQLVADIAQGKQVDAFGQLEALNWVQRVDDNKQLVDDYMEGLTAGKKMLVVAPTHAQGNEITAAIRERLKEEGKIGKEEKTFEQLVPLNWTDAEKGDVHRYDGTEVMRFHQLSGTFKAGQRIAVGNWKKGDRYKSPEHFSVYKKDTITLAVGDVVRFNAKGKTLDGHEVANGSVYTVKGFDKHDNLILNNDWTVAKDFAHLTHGYVSTSPGSQGKTVDRVIVAMGSLSGQAISAAQFYVSISRGREWAKVYTDMPLAELKEAIQRTDVRKSATELLGEKPNPSRNKLAKMLQKRYRIVTAKARGMNTGRELYGQRQL